MRADGDARPRELGQHLPGQRQQILVAALVEGDSLLKALDEPFRLRVAILRVIDGMYGLPRQGGLDNVEQEALAFLPVSGRAELNNIRDMLHDVRALLLLAVMRAHNLLVCGIKACRN